MFFRNHEIDSAAIDDSRERVLLTLEASGLRKHRTIIVGGAALNLMGLRPAGDVDTLVPVSDLVVMRNRGHTPSGQPVYVKPKTRRRDWIETRAEDSTSGLLDLDIGEHAIPFALKGNNSALFELFVARNPVFEGWHYLNAGAIKSELEVRRGKNVKRDLKLVEQYMHGRSAATQSEELR